MTPIRLQNKIKRRLAKAGISIEPGSAADVKLRQSAKVGADLITSGTTAMKAMRETVDETTEYFRDLIHEATKPPPGSAKAPQEETKPPPETNKSAGQRKR